MNFAHGEALPVKIGEDSPTAGSTVIEGQETFVHDESAFQINGFDDLIAV